MTGGKLIVRQSARFSDAAVRSHERKSMRTLWLLGQIRCAFQPISLASERRPFVRSKKPNKPQKPQGIILLNGERLLLSGACPLVTAAIRHLVPQLLTLNLPDRL